MAGAWRPDDWDARSSSRRGHPALALLAWIPYALTLLAT